MPGLNGGSPKGSICAVHETRIERIEDRIDGVDESLGRVALELSDLRTTLGRAPDPVTGTPGAGAVGILYRLGNTLLTGEPRGAMESIAAFDEGDVTKTMTRPDLVKRSKEAEDDAAKAKARVRLALIGLGVTLVSTVGTVAIAWLTK